MRIRCHVLAFFVAVLLAHHVTAQSQWPTKGWPTSTPSAVGLDPRKLAEFDAELASGKYGYIDNMLIIRHGKVVYDRSYKHDYDSIYGEEAKKTGPLNAHDPTGPYNYFNSWWHPFYRRGDLHTMQSVTKTVTSVVIGVATARKEFPELDTPILKFFDTTKVANIDDRKRRLTIRHLLTMTAGLDWNEDLPYNDPNNSASLMEASFDWVQFTIDKPTAHEPGAVFQYSSGVTQLLSHLFRVATGKDIEEYAAQHLFAPLGITHYYWKRSPSGLVDTEGGLYLKPHDLAKIGYLFLKNGVWDGKQIVQADWVKASVAPSVTASPDGVKYGFKWWLVPYGDQGSRLAWAGSGFGGQLPVVLPEHDIVMVFTGWNILPDKPRLRNRVAINHVLGAVVTASSAVKQDNRWISLFNGKNLKGWKVKIAGHKLNDNYGKTFRVENGILKVSYDQYKTFGGKFGHLFYKDKFSHYKLRVEYRFVGDQCPEGPDWALRNSGVMLHCQAPESMTKEQSFPVSIEAQFLGGNGKDERSTGNLCTPGTHVVMNGELITRHCTNSRSKTFHGDQWVTMEVEVHGDSTIKHIVNGEVVLEYEKPQLDENDPDAQKLVINGEKMVCEGYIALQAESHPIEFRKVEILILKGTE